MMYLFRRPSLAFAALLLAAVALPRVAEAQVGQSAVVFLMIEPDSRAAGMGNANVALADNANAVFWNPAGLGFQRGSEAGLTHSNWLPELGAGLFYEYLVGKHHVEGIGTFGGHVTYLFLGEHESRDEQGLQLGTFRSYDLAAGLSFGRQISSTISLGTGLRLIYSNLASGQLSDGREINPGVSFGLDLAALYRSQPITLGSTDATFSAGFNLANIGPTISYTDTPPVEVDSTGTAPRTIGNRDPIPTTMRFGTSVALDFDEYNRLNFAVDATKALVDRDSTGVTPAYQAVFSAWKPIEVDLDTSDEDPGETLSVVEQLLIGVGAEYWYNDLFALRAGYFYEDPYNGNRQFLTFGAGLRYNVFGVDFSYIYAMEENHPLSNTLRFSVLLAFAR